MFDYKQWIAKVTNWFNSPLVVTEEQGTASSVGANAGKNVPFNLSKSGYRPLAVVGFRASGSASGYAQARQYYMSSQSSGSGTATIYVWNTHTSQQTWTIYAYVLWVKIP